MRNTRHYVFSLEVHQFLGFTRGVFMTAKDMLGRSGVVSREEALNILDLHFHAPDMPSAKISISDALGRVLASDVISPANLPHFDRSTMDGYAVRSSDTFGAGESRPALLTITGDIPMGAMPESGITAGQVMKIATGGALPAGADAVVMLEHAQTVDAASIEVMKPVAPLENVVCAGDDIKQGELVLTRGHRLRPQDMAALAGLGMITVNVFNKPKVAIISTGNEIVPADTVPPPGKIRDTNSYALEGLIREAEGIPVKIGIIPDEYGLLQQALRTAISECSLVLMTGGSSVGTADLTAKVVNDMGRPGVLIHGVSIKPGKPLIFGLIETARGDVPVFGLPGHPVAVSVCFDLFVKRVLEKLTGEVPPRALEGVARNRVVKAKLIRSISSGAGREEHVRVALEKKDDGLWARPLLGASGLISTLVKAIGIVVVPVNTIGIDAGEEVDVRLF